MHHVDHWNVWEAKKLSRKMERVCWLIVCFKNMPKEFCNAEALQQENKQTNKGKTEQKHKKRSHILTLFVNPLRWQIKYAHLHTLNSISTLMVSLTSAFTVLFCLLGDRFELFIQPLFEQIVFNVQLLLTSHVHCIYTKICQEKKQMLVFTINICYD